MRRDAVGILVTVLGVAAAATALGAWLTAGADRDLERRVSIGEDAWERTAETPAVTKARPSRLTTGPGTPSAVRGSWPQFRGPNRDGVVRDSVRLATGWSAQGLPVLWNLTVGEGHAGVAVHRGRVYLIDYDRQQQEDAVRCLSLDDGQEIWRYTYPVRIKRNHGMSRTVPAVTDRFVVAIGPKCHVHCLDAVTGRRLWKIDLVREYGTTVPPWYAGQCALIDGDAAILAPAGRVLMMAVELATGRVRWQTPNPDAWAMTHCSIVATDRPGGREYIYCANRGVVGVDAATGKALWKWPGWRIKVAAIASPLVVDGKRIFFSGGYNAGSALARLHGQRETTTIEEVFRLKARVFGSTQQTPILYKGHIYGVIPNGQVVCLGLDGKPRWSSGPRYRFGLGPYTLADGRLLVLDDTGCVLHAIAARPDVFQPLDHARVLDGHDAWAPMALVAGRLILRDLTQLVCLDLRENRP